MQEILEFTSSPFLHLGYDEREMSTPCFSEVLGEKVHDFDKFEKELAHKMLKHFNVTSDQIIRHENMEKKHYSSRFGDITQCRTTDCGRAKSSSSPWFGLVDIRLGGVWDVYSKTHELAISGAIGLVAEFGGILPIDFDDNKILHRMLAFRIGIMENVPEMTMLEFEKFYIEKCTDFYTFRNKPSESVDDKRKNIGICNSIVGSEDDATLAVISVNAIAHLREELCDTRTRNRTKYTMKKVKNIPTALSLVNTLVERG
jgi:hypothetical protein